MLFLAFDCCTMCPYRLVVWSLYIRLLPKVSDKRIQNLSLNCQSFLCFCFSLSQSFNEYSVPGDFSQKHFWSLLSSKMPLINTFLIWIVVYLATFLNIFNSCSFFFFYKLKITQYFAKMPNFIISEKNPVNNLERCQQMLWEVNKTVEWFLKRGFGEFLHASLWKQSYIKTLDN